MLEAARRANADLPGTVAADILQHLSSTPRRPVVCLFGVAFKGRPAVKDVRGSVALEIARMLEREADDLEIRLWDPEIPAAALQVFGYSDSTDDPYRTAAGASVIVLANDHPALEELDLERLTGGAPETLIYDLCGVTRQTAREFGGFVRVLGCGDPANSLDRAMVTA
jgi:UDP-N-acetyl-D-mannosaminuronate dehydrogenase